MKKIAVIALASASLFVSTAARADLFSNVQFWVGSGQNEAAMEIDWNEGTSGDALVWGYRWDGTATAEQMVDSILAADPHLFAELSGFDTGFGTDVFGLGYQQSANGNLQLSPSLSFNSQRLAFASSYGAVDQSRTSLNAGDLWEEASNPGFWEYLVSTDSQLTGNYSDAANWNYASAGITGVTLASGDVDAFVFLSDFNDPTAYPSAPAAAPIPEPSTWAMLGLSALCLGFAKRKWGAAKKMSRQQAS